MLHVNEDALKAKHTTTRIIQGHWFWFELGSAQVVSLGSRNSLIFKDKHALFRAGHTVRSSSGPDIQKGKGTKRCLTDKPGVWSDHFESSGLYLRPILRRHGYHYEDEETEAQVIVGKEWASVEIVSYLHWSILPMHDSICVVYFRLVVFRDRLSHSSSCPQIPYMAKKDHELLYLLLPPPKPQDYNPISPCQAFKFLFLSIQLRFTECHCGRCLFIVMSNKNSDNIYYSDNTQGVQVCLKRQTMVFEICVSSKRQSIRSREGIWEYSEEPQGSHWLQSVGEESHKDKKKPVHEYEI